MNVSCINNNNNKNIVILPCLWSIVLLVSPFLVIEAVAESDSVTTTIPTINIGIDGKGEPVEMPLIGAGTWQYNNSIAYQSICKAFQVGYTLVDTAFGYGNEQGVGQAIQDCWQRSREELFVMTKLPGGLTRSQVMAAHQQNLFELKLDYVDHVMLHFPSQWDYENATYDGKLRRQEGWLALEDMYHRGEARSIGISHYCERHIMDILEVATIVPSINQVEYHIGSQDIDDVIPFCEQIGIQFMSFSPLCGPCRYDDPNKDSIIDGDLVTEIASHYTTQHRTVTGNQVALRYIVQQGIPVIPKSNKLAHIISNRNIFDFQLSSKDMKRLSSSTVPPATGGDCDVP